MTNLPLPSPKGGSAIFGNSLNRHVKNKRENKLQVTIVCVSLQCDFLGTTDIAARSFLHKGELTGIRHPLCNFFSAFMEGKVKIDHIVSNEFIPK